jgi:EF-P beta-lysylation protein EpmB
MSKKPVLSINSSQRDWKVVLSESLRTVEELLGFCGIEVAEADADAQPQFTLKVTRSFASLIEKGNASDPLLLQVLPGTRESQRVAGFREDPVGDLAAMPLPGLIHKYHGRVLLTMTGACAINCRYCFRRHFPYADNVADVRMTSAMMSYLSGNTDINEVILSGGDPLMVSDQKLDNLVGSLNRIPHIRTLRIHSRVPSVLPERVTPELLETLQRFYGKLVLVTHINHPNELAPHNRPAFESLFRHGITLFNQSVLLRGVNNCAGTLVELSRKLFDNHIIPYYLHRLDKVEGAAHFDVPATESLRIYRQMRNSLPGYLLPAMVDEIAGQLSKTPAGTSPE